MRFLVLISLMLLAMPAVSTFEIQDPAAAAVQDYEEHEKAKAERKASGADTGQTPCGEYVVAREEGSDAYWSYLTWLLGYLETARQSGDTTSNDPDAAARWVQSHCIANPSDRLESAAQAFVASHRG